MRLPFIITFAAFFLSCIQKHGKTTIRGVIEPMGFQGDILIEDVGDASSTPVLTIPVDEAGRFQSQLSIGEPGFYRINFLGRAGTNLALTSQEDTIDFFVSLNSSNPIKIVGSPATRKIKSMDSLDATRSEEVKALQQRYGTRIYFDPQVQSKFVSESRILEMKYDQQMKDMIISGLPGLGAVYGISRYINAETQFNFADSVLSLVEPRFMENVVSKSLVEQIRRIGLVAIGAKAPEISLPTPEGGVLTLSSLKGDYVLLDFWASWCRPCRIENPNVVRMYNQFRGKNFEILGISLDRTHQDWVTAIEQDALAWKHVSDLKYFGSQAALDYQVQAIPATFLLDPEGIILAKDLRGENLRSKLESIFEANSKG